MRYLFILLLLLSAHAKAEARAYSQKYLTCIAKAGKLSASLSETDRNFLDKVQHDWLTWRDGNYGFLSEHVAGEYVTTRSTSLDFILNAIYDRADELEMILTELGH
jgi:uncharacterized protein YecT (DUF1311 family)